MQHKIPQGSSKNTVGHKPNLQQQKNKAEITQMAIDACQRLGGVAQINEHYYIVDTRVATISPKIVPTVIPPHKDE